MWQQYIDSASEYLHGNQTTTTTTTEKPQELNPVIVILGIVIVLAIGFALFKSSEK